MIITYTNLSDYEPIKESIAQTTIIIEVQRAVRNKNNEVVDFEMYFISDVSGNRHLASKFTVCKRLLQMFPVYIVRACLDDLGRVLENDNYIQLKEYYGAAGVKTLVKNSVIKFHDSAILIFIDLSGINAKLGTPQNTFMQLHRANEELDPLANIVAHDLKEPLRKITMFFSMLEGAKDDAEKWKKYSQAIHYIVQGLEIKLDDLLLYLQIENKLSITEVDMNDLLRKVLFSLDYSMPVPAPLITVAALPVVKQTVT